MELNKSQKQSLSVQLRLALGPEETHEKFIVNKQETQLAIDAIIDALRHKANEHKVNLDVSDSFIVDCLFHRVYRGIDDKNLSRAYIQSSIKCVIQFLEWCKSEIEHRELEWRWLNDFDYDFYGLNVIEDYKDGECWRAKTTNTFMQYADIIGLLTGRSMPQPVTRDMFVLFGIRQILEAKFRRMLGFLYVKPMLKISHAVIPHILKSHENEFTYKIDGVPKLADVMHIYDWTESSIHNMSSNCVWLVWKATMFIGPLFAPANGLSNGSYFHLNGAIEITQECLVEMRNDLKKWIKANAKSVGYNDKMVVHWNSTETAVVDEKGRLVRVDDLEEEI